MARAAVHAGSWYKKEARGLNIELESYLNRVPAELEGICSSSKLSAPAPVSGARAIIAP
jgi:hypothetical protein